MSEEKTIATSNTAENACKEIGNVLSIFSEATGLDGVLDEAIKQKILFEQNEDSINCKPVTEHELELVLPSDLKLTTKV